MSHVQHVAAMAQKVTVAVAGLAGGFSGYVLNTVSECPRYLGARLNLSYSATEASIRFVLPPTPSSSTAATGLFLSHRERVSQRRDLTKKELISGFLKKETK